MGVWQETITHNYEEALKWYERAAKGGHEVSQEAYNGLASQLANLKSNGTDNEINVRVSM